ncbi:DUF4174 domain-containing protein [Paraferrimonas sedimenticola]|nr:DUF4174 domain-containing protein [Paraferrimonas sedimenticola]
MKYVALSILASIIGFVSYVAWAYPHLVEAQSHRSLIYFAPEHDDSVDKFVKQASFHECLLKARNTFVLVVTDAERSESMHYHSYDWTELRNKYQVGPDQTALILVSDDGQEAQRWDNTIWSEVFQMLDNSTNNIDAQNRRLKRCSA